MKICMLIEAWKPIWGGGQVHVWELCKRLVKNHNCKIDLYVMNLDGKKQESFFNGRLNISRIGKKTHFGFLPRLKWCREVIKTIKNKKYDLIHAHANLPGFPGKKMSKELGIPIIYTVHGFGAKAMKSMYGRGFKSTILAYLEKFLQTKMKYSKEISVDSRFLNQKNVNNPIVIPNGVDIKQFDSVSAKKSKKFKIIFVGRLHPQKGLSYLFDAVNLAKKDLKNTEFAIVGDGDLKEILKDKVKKLGLEKIIKFKGKLEGIKLIKEYKSSHLFILPSLYEGQPLTLLEAWAAKLPVLVTDVGDNNKFVVQDKDGWVVKPKDFGALANKLCYILSKKSKILEEIGNRGYEKTKSKYSWRTMAKKTYDVYRSVLK
ncbi:glycosyltransferase family 4 protein [Nanoarchaeota archaeon]